jgi:hypothetical protein
MSTKISQNQINGLPSTTLAEAIASEDAYVGMEVTISDRGYGVFEYVLASGVTPNTFNIVQCTGVATLALSLRIKNGECNVVHFGAKGIGDSHDDYPAVNAAAIACKGTSNLETSGYNRTLVIPNSPVHYMFSDTVDLSAEGFPSGALSDWDNSARNMAVRCGHEAKFSGFDNTVDLFDIEGQRRFKWEGGWFLKGGLCLRGAQGTSPVPSEAYAYFRNITFEPSGTGAIDRCYSSTTPIGVYFVDCDFGTDARNDGINMAVDMDGNNVGQSNLVKFMRCTFKGTTKGINLGDSTYARFGTSFTDCRFESIGGYVLNVGTNSRDVRLTNCYWEGCGSVLESPIIMSGGKLVIDGGQIAGLQTNLDSFITATGAGVEIETRGKIEYLASSATTKFIRYLATLAQPQYLRGVNIQGTATQTYKSLLFSTLALADEQYIDWEIPRTSSTLTDAQISKKSIGNIYHRGFLTHTCDTVNIAASATDYDAVAVYIPNAGNGARVSFESYQSMQGVGHAGQFNEWLAHWNGATWIFTSVSAVTTVAGMVFTPVSIDINNFKIQVRRTVGGATNSPFKGILTLRQAGYNSDDYPISIT